MVCSLYHRCGACCEEVHLAHVAMLQNIAVHTVLHHVALQLNHCAQHKATRTPFLLYPVCARRVTTAFWMCRFSWGVATWQHVP